MISKLEKKINQGARIILEKKENGITKYVEFENYLFTPTVITVKTWEIQENHSDFEATSCGIGYQEFRSVLCRYIDSGYNISFYPCDEKSKIIALIAASKIEPIYFYRKDFDEEGYPIFGFYKIEFIQSNAPKLYQSYFLIKGWDYQEASESQETHITSSVLPEREEKEMGNFLRTIMSQGYNFFYGSETHKNGEEYFNDLIGIGD